MKRSFLKLAVTSVLACWVVGFVALVLYGRNHSWVNERAQTDGVFLVHSLLGDLPVEERATRLRELQPNFGVDLSLITIDEVARRIGRAPEPGERIPHRVSQREEWYFVLFEDGEDALAAGPVNPTMPDGALPVGLIIAVLALPILAAFIAVRVERQLRKVEKASDALALGELSARVDNPKGPSNELAASFNAMAERIETLIRSKNELVQAVSHELGSPLSRLRFHLALLEETPEEKRRERTRAMTRDLDALDALVTELLSYVQSDDLTIEHQEFPLDPTLGDLAELAQLEPPGEQTVTVTLYGEKDVSIVADPRLFQRAIENLLRNGVRYASSQVELEVVDDKPFLRVSVHDDGPGIPAQLREKVMQPFVRLEEDRGRSTGGVGLGLAIATRILNRHGGRLEIGESHLGGAKVSTLWPKSAS